MISKTWSPASYRTRGASSFAGWWVWIVPSLSRLCGSHCWEERWTQPTHPCHFPSYSLPLGMSGIISTGSLPKKKEAILKKLQITFGLLVAFTFIVFYDTCMWNSCGIKIRYRCYKKKIISMAMRQIITHAETKHKL